MEGILNNIEEKQNMLKVMGCCQKATQRETALNLCFRNKGGLMVFSVYSKGNQKMKNKFNTQISKYETWRKCTIKQSRKWRVPRSIGHQENQWNDYKLPTAGRREWSSYIITDSKHIKNNEAEWSLSCK